MGLEHKSKCEIFKIKAFEAGAHVYFGDILGSKENASQNPIVGSWFRIEEGPEASPPKYEYDETGVLLEGDLTIKDETGETVNLGPGDTFIIHRGSTVAFSSTKYALAFKCGARIMAHL